MSLFGFNANKNPPTLTGVDTTSANQTINDLTITDKIIFEPVTSTASGNSAFNMSVDPTTKNMTINTPSASSIKFVQGDITGQTPIFNINPTSLNYKVGSSLQTLTYADLNNVSGSTSNIQNQINSITNAYGVTTGFWGSFYTKSTLINNQGSGVGDVQNACMGLYDPNTNGFSLADSNAAYTFLYNSIVVNNTGIYSISYQIKASHTNTTNDNYRIWLRLNGSDIPQSVAITNIPAGTGSNTVFQPSTLNWVMKLTAGDKIQPMWSSNVTGIVLPYSAGYSNPTTTSEYPVLVNIQQVVNTAVGPAGPAGSNGSAATVSVGSTTTLAAGSSATVSNSGTSNAAVLNFGIPQGIQGPQGAQGPKGDTGDTGYVNLQPLWDAINTVSSGLTSLAGVVAGLVIQVGIMAGAIAVIEGEISTIQGQVTALETDVGTLNTEVLVLQEKTVNQTAVVGTTTFAGSVATDTVAATTVNVGTVAADYINLAVSMGGVGKINLSSSVGANTIYAPSTTIASQGGFGGVYLGGFTDTVYISGLPLSFYFGQW
jgi:hypothetical protein